jgi:predicted ATPase
MRGFVLTGTPGSGKTAIIRQLELDGFSVVEEAATDIIALEQARGVAERGRMPLSSMRSLNCKDAGTFERRARPPRYSVTTGRSSVPLP